MPQLTAQPILQSSQTPGRGSPGELFSTVSGGPGCSQAGPEKRVLSSPSQGPGSSLGIGCEGPVVGPLVGKQPGLRNRPRVEPTYPRACPPTPHTLDALMTESSRRNVHVPSWDPRPQWPCNLMNCQHLGRNYWARTDNPGKPPHPGARPGAFGGLRSLTGAVSVNHNQKAPQSPGCTATRRVH